MKRSLIQAVVEFQFGINNEDKENYLKQVNVGESINNMIVDVLNRKDLHEAIFTLKNHKNTPIGRVQVKVSE